MLSERHQIFFKKKRMHRIFLPLHEILENANSPIVRAGQGLCGVEEGDSSDR